MFYSRMIRWLARLPAPYALGLLWWGEATVLLCSFAGGYLLSGYLFDNIRSDLRTWLFPIAMATYFAIFYVVHLFFSWNSVLMEGLIHIHRLGGIERIERLKREARLKKENQNKPDVKESDDNDDSYDPMEPPERIRASASLFRLRYFVVLPTALVLYLLGFASTIYRIFARQMHTLEPGYLVLPVLATVSVTALCYWLLMPSLPGYVSVRKLIGLRKRQGD